MSRNKSDWQCRVIEDLRSVIEKDSFWSSHFSQLSERHSVHLAVFVEPFLSYLLAGQKTVESRFSVVRCPPFRRVEVGDVILVKKAGGPICGICRVNHTWFYTLDSASWKSIRKEFSQALCAQDPSFWTQRKDATYATLLRIDKVQRIGPIECKKQDRRGWVILQTKKDPELFVTTYKACVVVISGQIGSGKTTLSNSLAKALGCPRVGFGDYVRNMAKSQNKDEHSRTVLQEIGQSLIEDDIHLFCKSVLSQVEWQAGQSLVVDGVRHLSVLPHLRDLASPSKLIHVHVSLPEHLRIERIRTRETRDELSSHSYEQHSTEHDVKDILFQNADLALNGANSVEHNIRLVLDFIAKSTTNKI